MKCACGKADCKGEIGIDTISGMIHVETDDGRNAGIYLDPNLAVQVIRKLHEYLREQAAKP